MRTVQRFALAVIALALLVAGPVAAIEPAGQAKDSRSAAPPVAPPPAATDDKGPGCMPGGGCCGGAACAQAAGTEKQAADPGTGGCPCMKRRQAADTPS